MCLALPGRILSVEGKRARVDFGGIEREILLDLVEGAGPGSWVLAHAGFAIEQLEEQEAREVLELFSELQQASAEVAAAEAGE